MDTPSTPPLEELLTHARWARALARQLLRDEQRADDVVQEAWLAAVERPPRPGPGLRAWFARLIRNLASNQRRAELRRALHERGAAAPELAASAAAAPVVDEFAAQQLVAQALLALDEPYRETLLRRWFRDEKPAAIAHAMQVPVKTVDTRLARGLERLRAELTARRGGTSRDWCLMLAPLAQAGTATGVVATWTGGALTTAGLAKLAAAAVVAAAAVATWSKFAAHRTDEAKAPAERAVASAQDPAGAPEPVAAAAAAEEATRSTEPREFTLEPRTYGTLVVRLRARDGRPLPRSIADGATIVYGFEALPRAPDGAPLASTIPVERKGDVYRIERAPAGVAIRLVARIGRDVLHTVRLEPLAPGETREVPLAIESGIVVAVRCIDAATREPVAALGIDGVSVPELRWTGPCARDHARRFVGPDVVAGPIVLPGPGHIEIEGTFVGYAPFRVAADVADGTPIDLVLTRWRRLFVKVRDAHGDPWKTRSESRKEDTTLRRKGLGFMAAGRAPHCVVVAAAAPLPSEFDPDTPRAARLQPRYGTFAIEGFDGVAPSEPLRVGVYDDGRLVGSTDVPATAPLLADGEPAGPTQVVTVDVALPPAADGALRFRAVGREDGRPAVAYEVQLEPAVAEALDSVAGAGCFDVVDPAGGLFSLSAIPAGDWHLRIRRGEIYVDGWVGEVSISAGRTTDLGTLTLDVPGRLVVRVVDDTGAPAADAEIRVMSADGKQSVEFTPVRGFARQTSVRTTSRPADTELDLLSGKVRVEVNSAGYATAFADVEVPPNGKATCTIPLKSLDPNESTTEPPADPSKR